MNKSARIYVAGHRGLVGSAILNALVENGYSNILTRTHNELDLIDMAAVNRFFNEEKPEYVFLAAAKVGGIVANNTYRADFLYENLAIQNNVIHESFKHGVKKLLFLGSTCIYPKETMQPIVESALLTGPLEFTNEPYAIAKIAGIKMCESYNLQYGTNFISAMPTNLYGPNDNFDLEKSHVLPALIRKISLGKSLEDNDMSAIRSDLTIRPIEGCDGNTTDDEIVSVLAKYGVLKRPDNVVQIEIWGSGKPRREFLWSQDMAEACLFIMKHRDFGDLISGKEYEVRNTHINIGTGEDISIKDLANLIKDFAGFRGSFFFNKEKPDGTIQKLTDIGKLSSLGWRYNITLSEGIKKMLKWYTLSRTV